MRNELKAKLYSIPWPASLKRLCLNSLPLAMGQLYGTTTDSSLHARTRANA
jgi:hypothetical protein